MDWIYLPANAAALQSLQSLWASLHDGELLSVCSNRAARTVTLEVDAAHIRRFQKRGDETRFLITCQGMKSARAYAFFLWEQDAPETPEKWVEESVGWNDFMAGFSPDTLDIYTAEMARGENETVLHLEGNLHGSDIDDKWFQVFLRCEAVAFAWSDGQSLTLEQFVQSGEDYWQARAAA